MTRYHAHPATNGPRISKVRELVETVAFFLVLFGIVVALSAVEPVR